MIYLDFDKEVEPFEQQVESLRANTDDTTGTVIEEIQRKEKEIRSRLRKIYKNLDSWQTCQVARHQDRPHTVDYIKHAFTGFCELHGDRMYSDDPAIIGGIARLEEIPVMVIGHEKGRSTDERIAKNWGMPHPEGYRKALRLMRLAERFKLPLVTLIDTPGAFCGVGAEERGMPQAIGANLLAMASLKTCIVSIVIGEGGSGGALGIGVCDMLMMLEHSVYSVITPEGCASILWKDGNGKAETAANEMRMRAVDLVKVGLVDEIVPEPIGGAHRNHVEAAKNLSTAATRALNGLRNKSAGDLIDDRMKRLRQFGQYTEKGGE